MDKSINFRYPGSRPFQDTHIDRLLFFGRDKEKIALLDKVLAQRLVVLFARSGLGKTSLINAGLMKALRKNGYLPFTIPLNTTDKETGEVIKPLQVIYSEIKKAVEEHKIDHTPGPEITLWQYFKTAQFWSEDDILMTPVLVLDQFEELFTLHHKKTRDDFVNQLADLIRGRLPDQIRDSIKSLEKVEFDDSPPNVKIIISIKEDYIGRLEEMSYEIPHILKNRFRLLPLNREQAKEAIVKPAELEISHINIKTKSFNYETDAINEMLDFLCKKRSKRKTEEGEDIEPFQLQLLCQHIENKIRKEENKMVVRSKDLGGRRGMLKILQTFYDAQVTGFHNPWERHKVRRLFNSGLIMSGLRISQHEKAIYEKFKISKKILADLVDSRLLRAETRSTGVYYELSHDTLVEPVLRSQKLRRKKLAYSVLSLVCIIVLMLAISFYPKTAADRYMKSGNALLRAGKYKKAVESFEKVVKVAPKNAQAYFQLGNSYSALRKYDKAVDFYHSAIKIKSNFSRAYLNLGNVYYRLKQYEDAITHYNESLKLDPQNARAKTGITAVYTDKSYESYRKNDFDSAINYIRKTFKYTPKNSDVYQFLGLCYYEKYEYEAAFGYYKQAYDLDPDNLTNKINLAEAYLLVYEFEKSARLAWEVIKDNRSTDEDILAMTIMLASSYLLQGNSFEGRQELENFIKIYKQYNRVMTKRWTFKGLKFRINLNLIINDYDKSYILTAIEILEGSEISAQKRFKWLETAMRNTK